MNDVFRISYVTRALIVVAGSLGTFLAVGALLQSFSVPSLAEAGQPRVNICHREGNGTHHQITIAAPAVPAHVAHGDAAIGAEVCNGMDDDCDGTIDEDFVPTTTSCGTGACGATGATSCIDGAVVDSCTPGSPSPEVCDGVDNDCNGVVDDGCGP